MAITLTWSDVFLPWFFIVSRSWMSYRVDISFVEPVSCLLYIKRQVDDMVAHIVAGLFRKEALVSVQCVVRYVHYSAAAADLQKLLP
jgi:hypothetical protein